MMIQLIAFVMIMSRKILLLEMTLTVTQKQKLDVTTFVIG